MGRMTVVRWLGYVCDYVVKSQKVKEYIEGCKGIAGGRCRILMVVDKRVCGHRVCCWSSAGVFVITAVFLEILHLYKRVVTADFL
jgi:hypothetical protein